MNEHFQFDREKFKDVVHYVIGYVCKHLEPEVLGNTKLHKILYYSDILRYLDTGNPLTGVDYQRQKFGPTARHLTQSLRDLTNEGRISIRTVNYFSHKKFEYNSLREPQIRLLADDERALLEHIIGFVCAHKAVEISDFSHDEVWASVPMGERIPYFAALAMFASEITDENLEIIAEQAASIAPLIEAERREGRIH